MQYDLFISYSRKDNLTGRVSGLKEKIEAEYLEFAEEDLKCFFDKDEIKGMDDWKQRLLQGLKDSHLLLLILSPNYLESPYCEWEVVEYLKYEYARATQGDGVAQIYFMEIPGLDEPEFTEKAKNWLQKVGRRQRFDFRPWYNEEADSPTAKDVNLGLEELKISLRNRIRRMRRIENAMGNLPAPNYRFVGREREMKLIHESVGLGKLGVLTAVNGMGGLGKTAIAFQYAYSYAGFYPGGRWQIECAGETNLATVLKKLDIDLKITFTEDEKKDDIRGAKRILNELECLTLKAAKAQADELNPLKPAVLLLLDNVDHEELIQPPNTNLITGKEWLKVLVTTRMGPEELGNDETRLSLISIDELPLDDALSLLESYQVGGRFKTRDEKEKAAEIVKLLGCFTLAVEVASLYLYERKGQISCADFLEMLKREGAVAGVDTAGARTKMGLNHIKLVSATLTPTLNMLDPSETLILNYAAFLPPDTIAVPWLRAMAVKDFPYLASDALAGLDDPWLAAINHLLSLRIIQIVELDVDTPAPRIVRMHRLVQETIQNQCTAQNDLMQNLCNHAFDRSEYLEKNWHLKSDQWEIEPIVAFTEYLLNQLHPLAPRMVKWIGQWLWFIFSYHKYQDLHLRAIEQLRNNPESQPTEIAILLSNIGVIFQELGDFTKAKSRLKEAIEIDEKYRKPDHPFLAIRYSNLALIEQDLGSLDEAKKLLLKAISIEEIVLDKDHPTLACSYNNLAGVERELGNYKEARDLNMKAIAIREKVLKSNHPDLAISYLNLAVVEKYLDNLKEARELSAKGIAILELTYKNSHPNLATFYNNSSLIELASGNLLRAKELISKALKIWEMFFDENHPVLATCYANLATIEQDLGNTDRAEILFKRALAIREKSLPPGHKDIASSFTFLIKLLQKAGRDKDVKELNIRLLDNERFEGDPSDLRNWALKYYQLEAYEKAEDILKRLKLTGFEPASTFLHLARIYLITDRLSEATISIDNAWSLRSEAKNYIVARILWFKIVFENLENNSIKSHLAQLKAVLQNEDALMVWTMDPVLTKLKLLLTEPRHSLLADLVAAMSYKGSLEKLNDYKVWRDAIPIKMTE